MFQVSDGRRRPLSERTLAAVRCGHDGAPTAATQVAADAALGAACDAALVQFRAARCGRHDVDDRQMRLLLNMC
eukprot:365228-Chlamydomonas_euryale.AAC.18